MAIYSTIGREVDGDPALGCPHMAQWWPVYSRAALALYGVILEIIQAKGSYAKSGRTHLHGTALDLRTYRFSHAVILQLVALAREMGARATWYRTTVGSGPHIHLVIDCPCRTGADYQTVAVDDGYDGLGTSGRSGRDPHPRPSTRRTYAQGITWATERIDNMPLNPSDIAAIRAVVKQEIAAAGWTKLHANAGKSSADTMLNSSRNNNDIHVSIAASAIRDQVAPQVAAILKAVTQ